MRIWTKACVAIVLSFLLSPPVQAAQVHGSADFGIWYLNNDLASHSQVQVNDSVGESFISSHYSLGMFGLRLTAKDLLDGDQGFKLNANLRNRSYIRLTSSNYTLGINDKYRGQLEELNVQAEGLGGHTDLWLGRQSVYEAGYAMFDGVRVVYHPVEIWDVGLYGGLNADLRSLAGYIGPTYRNIPFNPKLRTGGLYTSLRGDSLKADAAFHADFFKSSIDRVTFFTQASYQYDSVWSFSGLAEYDLAGVSGLRNINLSVISRPTPGVTNTLTAYRWSAVDYSKSGQTDIPPPSSVDATRVNNTDVNTSSYTSFRDHIMFRIFQRNYIFSAFQFTRRSFDDQNQYKYSVGYRDPALFAGPIDLRLQTDVIDNFEGFNAGFDMLMGRDFGDGEFRVEGGGSWYANERDVFLDFKRDPNQARQTEKEYAVRTNFYWSPSKITYWVLNYTYWRETDGGSGGIKVHSHEVYLTTNLRF